MRLWQCSVFPEAEAVAVSAGLTVAGSDIDSPPPPAAICRRIIAGSYAICPLAATNELRRHGRENEVERDERKRNKREVMLSLFVDAALEPGCGVLL